MYKNTHLIEICVLKVFRFVVILIVFIFIRTGRLGRLTLKLLPTTRSLTCNLSVLDSLTNPFLDNISSYLLCRNSLLNFLTLVNRCSFTCSSSIFQDRRDTRTLTWPNINCRSCYTWAPTWTNNFRLLNLLYSSPQLMR
jgi:hypothetical protein